MINDNGDIHPEIQENMENQSMQEQLDQDPEYLIWAELQKEEDRKSREANEEDEIF